MYADPSHPEPGMMGSYAAVFVFALGIFLSSFIWNTLAMRKPFIGEPASFARYFEGSLGTHVTCPVIAKEKAISRILSKRLLQ